MTDINRNPALGVNFLLEIPQAKELNYFIQTVDVPGLTMAGVDTPFKNVQASVPSNRIDFDQLNLTFIVDEGVENAVSEIKSILYKEAPYKDIPKLPELIDRFRDAYMKVLTSMEAPVLAAIDDARNRVFEVLNAKDYKDD